MIRYSIVLCVAHEANVGAPAFLRLVFPEAFGFLVAHLCLQRLNLHLERVILSHLALQELTGQRHLFGNALGGEQVDVLELVLALLEVAHLHEALFDEGVQAIVQATHAHAKRLGQLSLGQVWVVLQDAHDPKVRFFLELGLGVGHRMN